MHKSSNNNNLWKHDEFEDTKLGMYKFYENNRG